MATAPLRFAPLRSARALRALAPLGRFAPSLVSRPDAARKPQKKRKRAPGMHYKRASRPPALIYGEGEPLPLPLALPCPLRPEAEAPLHHPPLISFAPLPAGAPLSSVLHLWPFCREKMDGDFFSISPTLSGIDIHFLASACPAGVGQRGSRCRRRGKGGGG